MLLSDALFSATQQKVLGLLFGKPDRSFYANEIVRAANMGKGSVMRELGRLRESGIVTLSRHGNQTRYQANPACPIYPELLGIVRKTFGLTEQLRQALEPLAPRLAWAFVYGSVAEGTARADSDVDLMLIGMGLQYQDVMELLTPLEERLGRTINPTLYTVAEWLERRAAGNGFVVGVERKEKLLLYGNSPEVTDDTHGTARKSGKKRRS